MQKKITNHKQLVEAIKSFCVDGMHSAEIDMENHSSISATHVYCVGEYDSFNSILSIILSAEKDIK